MISVGVGSKQYINGLWVLRKWFGISRSRQVVTLKQTAIYQESGPLGLKHKVSPGNTTHPTIKNKFSHSLYLFNPPPDKKSDTATDNIHN